MNLFTKKIFNTDLRYSGKGEYYGNPATVWLALLVFFAVALAVVFAANVRLFSLVKQERLYQELELVQKPIAGIRVGRMDTVVQYLQKKEARFQEIMMAPGKAIDPSL